MQYKNNKVKTFFLHETGWVTEGHIGAKHTSLTQRWRIFYLPFCFCFFKAISKNNKNNTPDNKPNKASFSPLLQSSQSLSNEPQRYALQSNFSVWNKQNWWMAAAAVSLAIIIIKNPPNPQPHQKKAGKNKEKTEETKEQTQQHLHLWPPVFPPWIRSQSFPVLQWKPCKHRGVYSLQKKN